MPRGPALLALLLALTPIAAGLSLTESPGEVIVGYHDGSLEAAATLIHALGGSILRTDEDLRVHVARASDVPSFLAAALADPAVEFAEENDEARLAGAQWNGAQWNGAQWNFDDGAEGGDPGVAAQWGLEAIRAQDAWNVSTGERGAKLCVLDSGLAWDHPDLSGNAASSGVNFVDTSSSAYDDAGHGTHVAGVAAAEVGNGVGTAGVGNVRILPVKVLDADGRGHEDDIASGLAWCANQGADVALMALSVDDDGPTMRRAIAYAVERDVLLVASAGNGGPCSSCVAFPARHPDVLAVGAVDSGGALASFSSTGREVDLLAPGVDIVSTFTGDSYASGSGTSQAAAFAAGAAALVRDAEPHLSAPEARARLEASAEGGALRMTGALGGTSS